jgi:hypothetical protein
MPGIRSALRAVHWTAIYQKDDDLILINLAKTVGIEDY